MVKPLNISFQCHYVVSSIMCCDKGTIYGDQNYPDKQCQQCCYSLQAM